MTTRVALLLTGKCERDGMPEALRDAFAPHADATFTSVGELHSFTSKQIDIDALAGRAPGPVDGPVDKLASAVVSEVLTGRWDLVLAVDDLELCNAGRGADVSRFFARTVERELERIGATSSERARVAAHASFHLLVPMVEAYFFGEPLAIERALREAGVTSLPTWSIDGATLETFHTSDRQYLDDAHDTSATAAGTRKTTAWRTDDREDHPKHYLEFLCRDTSRGYREGRAGVAALRALSFVPVLGAGAPHFGAMLEDIQDALGIEPRVFASDGPIARGTVLRNIDSGTIR